jgi:cytochrome P450
MTTAAYHQPPSADVPAPAGCPVDRGWSPLSPAYLADPYSAAAALREHGGAFYSAQLGYLVITSMADIDAVFTDHETFASANVQDPVFPLDPAAAEVLSAADFDPVAVMSNRPEPEHGRIRGHTRQGFSNRRLATLEPFIRQRTDELIDSMLTRGSPAEFVQALAFPLPGETVFRFIGFPAADDELLKRWCLDRKSFSWGHPTGDEQVDIASRMLAYWRYCRTFVADKRDHRGDDFTSELLDAHDADNADLTYGEVESIVYGLSFAGHEAVTALLCNSLLCLLPRREQWAELATDPAVINNAVEEVLRFESSQISWRRVTTRPTTLAGYDLPAGTKVFMNFASANREPGIFDNPDSFDIHRPNANRHISFGKGVHYCLGAMLAKVEARIVIGALAACIPTLRLVGDQNLEYSANITFRGPNQLLVEWDEHQQGQANQRE